MIVEIIEKITKIEKDNEEKLRLAQKEKENIIGQAYTKAEGMKQQARTEAEEELKKKAGISEKNAVREIEAIRSEYVKKSQQIVEAAKKNFKPAVELVLNQLDK